MKFIRDLIDHCVKPHPLAFVLFLFVVVLVLGGILWKGIGLVLGLVRKVPGVGAPVANAVERVATATGSK